MPLLLLDLIYETTEHYVELNEFGGSLDYGSLVLGLSKFSSPHHDD
jgi:hypothetical protein